MACCLIDCIYSIIYCDFCFVILTVRRLIDFHPFMNYLILFPLSLNNYKNVLHVMLIFNFHSYKYFLMEIVFMR